MFVIWRGLLLSVMCCLLCGSCSLSLGVWYSLLFVVAWFCGLLSMVVVCCVLIVGVDVVVVCFCLLCVGVRGLHLLFVVWCVLVVVVVWVCVIC